MTEGTRTNSDKEVDINECRDDDDDDGEKMAEEELEEDQLAVPSDVPALRGVHYLHGLFPEVFLQELDELPCLRKGVLIRIGDLIHEGLPAVDLCAPDAARRGCLRRLELNVEAFA